MNIIFLYFSTLVDIPSLSHAILSLSRPFLRRQPSVACDAIWWPVLSSKQRGCGVSLEFLRCKIAEGHQVFLRILMTASGVALPTCPLAFAEARLVVVSDEPLQYCPMT